MDISVDIDKQLGILTLVRGHTGEKRYWALMSVYPSRYEEYAKKISNGDEMIVTDYGIVIETEYGLTPSKEKLKFYAEKYGADTRFLDKGGLQ